MWQTMKEWIAFVIGAVCITLHPSFVNPIGVPILHIRDINTRQKLYQKYKLKPFQPLRSQEQQRARRQNMEGAPADPPKDQNLKEKIGFMIDQALNDANREYFNIQQHKERFNGTAEYKIGFLMYMVKRSRDVMNELFSTAVAHKEDWKALDQLKILELIIHTNVDTSNLLRQLVEVAIEKKPGPASVKRLGVALL